MRISSGDNKFFISTQWEEKLSKKLGRQLIVFYVLGVGFILGGVGDGVEVMGKVTTSMRSHYGPWKREAKICLIEKENLDWRDLAEEFR